MIKSFKVGKWSVLTGYLIAAFILYFPILTKGFVSDDFTVLFRLIYKGDFTPPGFFRPGADLSLYSTYILSGLNPVAYNVSNLVIHVLNAWLIFLVCSKFFFLRSGFSAVLPFIASFIFLIYPFHQEPIVWVLGRGILLSSLFALTSLYILLSYKNSTLSIITAVLFYFLSLLCYESGVFIPIIAFLFLRSRKIQNQKLLTVMLLYSVALAAHLAIRIYFSGSVIGAYGKDFSAFDPVHFLYEYAKFWLRLVMVPVTNTYLFIATAFFILSVLVFAGYKLSKRNISSKDLIIGLAFILFISFLIPAFFGITIHTSEGDRFLYFPSIFLSVFLGLIFTHKIKLTPFLISAYAILSVVLIITNNRGWVRSSEKVDSIIGAIGNNAGNTMIIYNLPGSKNGKYIFRNGFREALHLNKIDTTGIFVYNTVEEGVIEMDQVVQPPVKVNEKNVARITGKIPFDIVPPYSIMYINDNRIRVFKVGK